jgi:hypothetical protein
MNQGGNLSGMVERQETVEVFGKAKFSVRVSEGKMS